MGGRGASSGVSVYGNKYGSQYHTIFKWGNIKFVMANNGAAESLLETMTRGRVYVLVGDNGPKSIIYFDNGLKRSKRLDLDHWHAKMKPHVQHGYFDNETDIENGVKVKATHLNIEEQQMVVRVSRLWHNHISGKK
mgnify:CR=1 FL=1